MNQVASLVTQKYVEKDYLFPSLKPTISEPISAAVLKQLQAFEGDLLHKNTPLHEAKRWLGLLDGITAEMLKGDVQIVIFNLKNQLLNQALYSKFENKFIAIANNAGFKLDELRQILPETVLVKQFGTCI